MSALLSPRAAGCARLLFAEDFDDLPGVTVIEAPTGREVLGREVRGREVLGRGALRPEGLHPGMIEPEVIEPVFTAADLAAAGESGRREGRATALAEVAAAQSGASADALARIADALAGAAEERAGIAEAAAGEIARLVMTTLMTILPVLCARHGEAEVRAIVRAVLPPLVREPAVTVRVSPHFAPTLQAEIAAIDPDLAERVRLVPTDAMEASDVRITWGDGSAVRDSRALWGEVASVLSQAGLLMPELPMVGPLAFAPTGAPGGDNAHGG